MTIRKQWLIVLLLTSIISVSINTVLLNQLINRYYIQVTKENYDTHLNQIIEISKGILSENNLQQSQIEFLLKAHLSDPIVGISLYDESGLEIAEVRVELFENRHMMNNTMMNFMMGRQAQEVDSYEIIEGNNILGNLLIVRQSSIANSLATRAFSSVLILNSIISFIIVLAIATIIGIAISKKMSKDLNLVLNQAVDIQMGINNPIKYSNVFEIKALQQNLDNLNNKLKLRQKSRKTLIDEIIHQANTPLTILKTHLEAYKDNIIEMTPEQMEICEMQIDAISSIINNLESVMDAEQSHSEIKIENVEISKLLNNIISGLNPVFKKKNTQITVSSKKRIRVETDKYLLSQSIYNVLTNAFKFSPPNSQILIDYKKVNNKVEIKIKDFGSGISQNDQKHLFEAYYRGENTSDIPGEGLGLFIAADNLKKFKGDISIESKIGEGSTFIIEIPEKLKIQNSNI